MPRPRCCRRITGRSACAAFGPVEEAAATADGPLLSPDEFEAIRLADHEGLYQEEAAARMGVSRQTFGRIVASGRSKVAEALVRGLTLRIAGPAPESGCRAARCPRCAMSKAQGCCAKRREDGQL
ncbi:DUF134 domain-containing protein [Fundidesulfovibrio agrisoli]|uniref:DUF134 domain-containing protein n=1 Tax=Fundidesulfovibrio agrisoli TaxID=2922717 RepID=UPI001FAB9601|nr:DUF134 domain-containing protein [Fundidesulfovibrio agrisoli]